MFRSVIAVIAGIVVLTVTSFAIEALVTVKGAGMTAYTLLCVVAGGYVTARIARRAPLAHAGVMGALELLFTIGAMVQLGQPGGFTAWLPGMLLMIPAALAGGMLRRRQDAHADALATVR